MEDILIKIPEKELNYLKKLISDFDSYYEDDSEWSFDDLENQRAIAFEMVEILKDILEKSSNA